MAENAEKPKLDVESIIAEIRQDAQRAEGSVPAAEREAVRVEDDLRGNLAAANRSCAVGAAPQGLAGRVVYRLIRPLIGEINGFHAHVVRALNRIVRILEGEDASVSGEVVELQKRRVALLEKLSARLAEYDALQIEERLRALEHRTGGKDAP